MRLLKYFFGWLGVVIDIGCLLIVAYVLWLMHQPGDGDAFLLLVFGGPILLVLMLVAFVVAIACFRSLHNKDPFNLVWRAGRHGKDTKGVDD